MPDDLQTEAARVWKLLQKRDHTLARDAANVIAEAMKRINELQDAEPTKKRGELHPLHRRLILCCQTRILSDRRDSKEETAFKKVAKLGLQEDALAALERFYKARKSEKHDETWNRKTTPTILMNNITAQIELALAWCDRHKPKPRAVDTTPPEPQGWRKHAPGAFQEDGFSSWFGFCRDYPEDAKRVMELTKNNGKSNYE